MTAQPPLAEAERVKAALRTVLELDAHSAGAQELWAKIADDYDWDWPSAERDFQWALEQGARPGIRASYCWALATRGRFAKAHNQCRIAESADPLGAGPRTSQFWIYYFERDYAQAKKTLRGLLDLNRDSLYAHALLGLVARLEKNCGESWAQFQLVAQTYPLPVRKCGLTYASACGGDSRRALRYLRAARARPRRRTHRLTKWPWAIAGGRPRRPDPLFEVRPVFDEIRSDARYIALENTVGLLP